MGHLSFFLMGIFCYRDVQIGILGVIGIVMGALTPLIFNLITETQLIVKEGSYSYEIWKDLPVPMYMKETVFYFNVTNAEEIMESIGKGNYTWKPLLKQIGPYTFREDHHKHNITFKDDGDKVSYYQAKSWNFEPDLSSGFLEDEFYTLNPIAYSAADQTRWPGFLGEADSFTFFRYMMDQSITQFNEKLFIKTNISAITFDGIDDDMLHINDQMPEIDIPFDRFGWFYDRNSSVEYDGEFEMWTGKDDIQKLGQITGYRGKDSLSWLYPDTCSKLDGSAGEFFPPKREKDAIYYFTPDLCRPIFFNFKEEVDFELIKGYKYWLDQSFVANGTQNSSASCYNPDPDFRQPIYVLDTADLEWSALPMEGSIDVGLYNGVLNVSSCKFNTPSYVSFPHFYQADPILLDMFHEDSDLNPNEEDHSSHLTLMPEPGIPLDVTIRMQINLLLREIPGIKLYENIPTIMFPMIWFETYTELPDDMKTQLLFLEWANNLKNYLMGLSIGLGCVFLMAGIVTWVMARKWSVSV